MYNCVLQNLFQFNSSCAGGEVGVEIGAGGLPINRCGFIRVDEDVEEGQGSVK